MRQTFFAVPTVAIMTFALITVDVTVVKALNMRSDELAQQHIAMGESHSPEPFKRQGLSLTQIAEMADIEKLADSELAQNAALHPDPLVRDIPEADDFMTSAQTISEAASENDQDVLALAQQEFQWYGSG